MEWELLKFSHFRIIVKDLIGFSHGKSLYLFDLNHTYRISHYNNHNISSKIIASISELIKKNSILTFIVFTYPDCFFLCILSIKKQYCNENGLTLFPSEFFFLLSFVSSIVGIVVRIFFFQYTVPFLHVSETITLMSFVWLLLIVYLSAPAILFAG